MNTVRRIKDHIVLYTSLLLLGTLCLSWVPCALLLSILPRRAGQTVGRFMIMFGLRIYISAQSIIGAYHFDHPHVFDTLRDEIRKAKQPLIIAANHPAMIDAFIIISRFPDITCIMKASLLKNIFLGAAARLARYVPNHPSLAMVNDAVENLKQGYPLLIFPEGTRSNRWPVGAFQSSIGIIAKRANAAIQTVLIETDNGYLSKGWTLFRCPEFPIHCRIRLGKRFEPQQDVNAGIAELEQYFAHELRDSPYNAWAALLHEGNEHAAHTLNEQH